MPRRTEAMVTRRARENSEGQRSRGRFAPVAGARDRLHRCREIDSSQESWLGLRLLTHLVTRYCLRAAVGERPAHRRLIKAADPSSESAVRLISLSVENAKLTTLCLLFKASGIKVAHAP